MVHRHSFTGDCRCQAQKKKTFTAKNRAGMCCTNRKLLRLLKYEHALADSSTYPPTADEQQAAAAIALTVAATPSAKIVTACCVVMLVTARCVQRDECTVGLFSTNFDFLIPCLISFILHPTRREAVAAVFAHL